MLALPDASQFVQKAVMSPELLQVSQLLCSNRVELPILPNMSAYMACALF